MTRLEPITALIAAPFRNRLPSIIAKLLTCAPADNSLCNDSAFVRTQTARVVGHEGFAANFAVMNAAIFRIDGLDRHAGR